MFMSLVAMHQGDNKMGEYNLAIVIGPNILRREIEDINSMADNSIISSLVEFMIRNANTLFPGDEDFSVTSPLPKKEDSYQAIQPLTRIDSPNHMKKMDSPKLQGHRRKSSYDGVLQANTHEALQAGFTEQPTYATIEKTTKLRKNKQKAPLPPQRPPSSVPTTKPPTVPTVPATRPPSVSAPKLPAAAANNTKDTSAVETHQQIRKPRASTMSSVLQPSGEKKPPIAVRRASTRKPSQPPMRPPQHSPPKPPQQRANTVKQKPPQQKPPQLAQVAESKVKQNEWSEARLDPSSPAKKNVSAKPPVAARRRLPSNANTQTKPPQTTTSPPNFSPPKLPTSQDDDVDDGHTTQF